MPLLSFEICDFTPINIQLVCVFIFIQIACARGCTIELAALVFIHCAFSNTALNALQFTCKDAFTLVAFLLILSIVCFQMPPQMACPRGCIATLVAFV